MVGKISQPTMDSHRLWLLRSKIGVGVAVELVVEWAGGHPAIQAGETYVRRKET